MFFSAQPALMTRYGADYAGSAEFLNTHFAIDDSSMIFPEHRKIILGQPF